VWVQTHQSSVTSPRVKCSFRAVIWRGSGHLGETALTGVIWNPLAAVSIYRIAERPLIGNTPVQQE